MNKRGFARMTIIPAKVHSVHQSLCKSTLLNCLFKAFLLGIIVPLIVNAQPGLLQLKGIPAYATYFGGTGDDYSQGMAFDRQGNVILIGSTTSNDIPGTQQSFQRTRAQGIPNHRDVFIAKFNVEGKQLQWATYLGGDGDEIVQSFAVDPNGSIVISGETNSTNFPVSLNGWRTERVPGRAHSFVAKISSDGRTLLGSTYLPEMTSTSVVVAPNGDIAVAAVGYANPTSLITPGAVTSGIANPSSIGSIFLFRLNFSLTGLIFCAHLGGGSFDGQRSAFLTIDSQSNFVVVGSTGPGRMPIPQGAFQPTYPNENLSGLPSGYMLSISASGTRVVSGTYFGPRFAVIQVKGVAANRGGAVWILGHAQTSNLAVTSDAIQKSPSSAFVGRLRQDASGFEYLSYLPVDTPPQVMSIEADTNIVHMFQGPKYTRADLRMASTLTQTMGFGPGVLGLQDSGSLWAAGNSGTSTEDAYQSKQLGREDVVVSQIKLLESGISIVTSAATTSSGFACGLLISIFGQELGPAIGVAATLQNGSLPTQLAGTRVVFGPASVPAPVLYVRSDQVNTTIPFSTCGQSSVDLTLERNGIRVSTIRLTLAPAAPGLFTINFGRGQVAALNQNFTVNSRLNPIHRGEILTLYSTGLGSMDMQVVDGTLAGFPLARPTNLIQAIIGQGGIGDILYAGSSPGIVHGVTQINVRIPDDAPLGDAIPIVLRVGSAFSQTGASVAIQ
jgi:uncharacterized protein (TIGR03437 family)